MVHEKTPDCLLLLREAYPVQHLDLRMSNLFIFVLMHMKSKYSFLGMNNEFSLERKHAKPFVCYRYSSQNHFYQSESSILRSSTPKKSKKKSKSKAVPLHAMEAHGGERRYSSCSYLTSALDGDEWSASRLGRALPPGKGPPVPIG
jgi:hypothetical protein